MVTGELTMDGREKGAAQQGDEADEARVELGRGVVRGLLRGRACDRGW